MALPQVTALIERIHGIGDQVRQYPELDKPFIYRSCVLRSVEQDGSFVEAQLGVMLPNDLYQIWQEVSGLRLFEDVSADHIRAAEGMVKRGEVQVEVVENVPDVYIQVEVRCGAHRGAALIRGEHAHIACLWRDGEIVYGSEKEAPEGRDLGPIDALKDLNFAQVVALVEDLPPAVIEEESGSVIE